MQLLIDGHSHDFTPIKAFRAAHHLPDTFGIAHFEPKEYHGLGSIEHKGAELNFLRQMVIEAIPAQMTPPQWLKFLPNLQKVFRRYLMLAGTGLREFEVDFAVAGFENVCQALIYAKIQADALRDSAQSPQPTFESVYDSWLQSTVRLSRTAYDYDTWRVQIVNHAYGRVGLRIQANNEIFYVWDNELACPAERFMHDLLGEIAKCILV